MFVCVCVCVFSYKWSIVGMLLLKWIYMFFECLIVNLYKSEFFTPPKPFEDCADEDAPRVANEGVNVDVDEDAPPYEALVSPMKRAGPLDGVGAVVGGAGVV